MGKRGSFDLGILWTFYILLVIAVFLTLVSWVRDQADGTSFRQQYESKKISLALDTVAMSNSDVSLVLPRDRFSYFIKDGVVSVNGRFSSLTPYAPTPYSDLSVSFTPDTLLISRTVRHAS